MSAGADCRIYGHISKNNEFLENLLPQNSITELITISMICKTFLKVLAFNYHLSISIRNVSQCKVGLNVGKYSPINHDRIIKMSLIKQWCKKPTGGGGGCNDSIPEWITLLEYESQSVTCSDLYVMRWIYMSYSSPLSFGCCVSKVCFMLLCLDPLWFW